MRVRFLKKKVIHKQTKIKESKYYSKTNKFLTMLRIEYMRSSLQYCFVENVFEELWLNDNLSEGGR